MLSNIRTDFRLKLYLAEVVWVHLKQVIEFADVLVY